MAVSEVYVDPSIAADSGAGTVGDPYGDLEYAIEQTTFDTTNGTRVNIKAGTAEVLAATLDTAMANAVTTPAWVPSASARCIFQGYTTAAGDGGLGSISGGGSVSIMNSATADFIDFIDMDLHTTGSNDILYIGDNCTVIKCKLHGTTATAWQGILRSTISQSYIYDVTGNFEGLYSNNGQSEIKNNFIEYGGTLSAVRVQTQGLVTGNIIKITNTGCDRAIQLVTSNYSTVQYNSIYSSVACTGIGIDAGTSHCEVTNNLVEGFSGVGGVGIDTATAGRAVLSGGNAVYNCTTAYEAGDPKFVAEAMGDNETLSASPFNDAANDDFSPVDTGNVKEGALPQIIGGGLVP